MNASQNSNCYANKIKHLRLRFGEEIPPDWLGKLRAAHLPGSDAAAVEEEVRKPSHEGCARFQDRYG